MAVRPVRGGQGQHQPRARRAPGRYDLSLPGNQRKLEIVTELAAVADDAGVTMVELALAFVLEHPAISAAIIGPPHHGAARDPAVGTRRPPGGSRSSTGSTRSFRPGPPSTGRTPDGRHRHSSTPGSVAATTSRSGGQRGYRGTDRDQRQAWSAPTLSGEASTVEGDRAWTLVETLRTMVLAASASLMVRAMAAATRAMPAAVRKAAW